MSERAFLPVLTTRNTVLFPYVAEQATVDRPSSVAAVEAALAKEDKLLAVFAQHDGAVEKAGRGHIYPVGTKAVVKNVQRSEQGLQVTLLGLERISIEDVETEEPILTAAVGPFTARPGEATEVDALQRQALELAGRLQHSLQVSPESDIRDILAHLEGPMHLVFLLASMLNLTVEKAQILLQLDSHVEALKMLDRYMLHELQVLELQQKISSQTRTEIDREQREYFLRRQLRTIRAELGESEGDDTEAVELRRRLERLELPEGVRHECERELKRMAELAPMAPELPVTRAHLELILELPWSRLAENQLDMAETRRQLDEAHYGLAEVKERILEHLAVLHLNPQAKAPILCLVGPPGVGKTSLGESVAHALGRPFERISLGGLRDEAELRGHRRTYVGAMPGRLIQAIRRAEVKNPLLMLDEVDKVGRDYRGDPTSVLLEILDPAQNHTFRDNYLGLSFDLSKVFFIATANSLDPLPRPLRDRMETIRLSGYSDEEKVEIGRRFLLPRRRRETGLSDDLLQVGDETLLAIVRRYTREAGVRQLQRMLGRLARKVALRCAEGQCEAAIVRSEDLADTLGPSRFFEEEMRESLPPGVAAGLAWTEAGGDVLYVEAIRSRLGEPLILTGQLGDVMKESARTAQSYVLSKNGSKVGDVGVHIHVPAGAIPKDGPSAGVTMAVALASLYRGVAVRSDTAMTGEITLSGLVLPVGGVKEKVLAARRSGLKRVILPRANEKDLGELPESVRGEMKLVLAETLSEVISAAIPIEAGV